MNISPSPVPVSNLHPPHSRRPRQVARRKSIQVRGRPTPSAAPRPPQSAYDSQRRYIHGAHLIASGASDTRVAVQTGLNPLQVRTVRQHHALGLSGANGNSAAVGVGQARHAGRP